MKFIEAENQYQAMCQSDVNIASQCPHKYLQNSENTGFFFSQLFQNEGALSFLL